MPKIKNKHKIIGRPRTLDEVSRTKIGGILLGVSTILAGTGNYLVGEADIYAALHQISIGIAEILIIVGVRNAL